MEAVKEHLHKLIEGSQNADLLAVLTQSWNKMIRKEPFGDHFPKNRKRVSSLLSQKLFILKNRFLTRK